MLKLRFDRYIKSFPKIVETKHLAVRSSGHLGFKCTEACRSPVPATGTASNLPQVAHAKILRC